MTAVEARAYVGELEAERAAAIANDVIAIDAYRRDLDAEIELWRRYFVTTAVAEIATPLRRARRRRCRLDQARRHGTRD